MGKSTPTPSASLLGQLISSALSLSPATSPPLSAEVYLDNDSPVLFFGFETTPAQLRHSIVISTLCLYFYDYLCTLDREVRYVWSSPQSLGTYLFFLNRYLPFCDLMVALHALGQHTPQECLRQYTAIMCLNTMGIAITQTILSLRTLAMWQRNRWVLGILLTIYFGTLIPSILIIKIFMSSLKFTESPSGLCTLPSASKVIILSYLLILVSETSIVVLTLIRAIKHLRHSNSTWVHQLYTRGFLFYFFTLGVTIMNVVYPFIAQPALRSLFTVLQRALHSMLCTRVVFIILSRQRQDEINYCDTYNDDHTRSHRSAGWRTSDGTMMTSMLDTYITNEDVCTVQR